MVRPGFWLVLAALVGLLLAAQAGGVRPRYIKFAVGLAYVFILIRLPLYWGLGLFIIVQAFPTTIWIGNTSFIFTILITVVWFARIALRLEERPHGTYLDWAILAYMAVQLLSMVNIETPGRLGDSLFALRHLMVPIALFYVIVNVGQSEKKMLFFAEMLCLCMLFVYFSAFMERYFPGVRFLPVWYLSALGARTLFIAPGAERIGGIFSHALLADSAAITLILQVYLAVYYKRRPWLRVYHWLMAALSVYVISISGNRGGLIILIVGMFYFLWTFSREISLKRVVVVLAGIVGVLAFAELTLRRFGEAGLLLARMARTYIERGVPDTRQSAWEYIWERIMENPILGHGPFLDIRQITIRGRKPIWPHNAYLWYLFTSGILGLLTYLVLAGRAVLRAWAGRGLDIGKISLARGLSAVYHIGMVQFLLAALRTDHQRADTYVYFMWIILALGILAREVWERQKSEARSGSAEAGSA